MDSIYETSGWFCPAVCRKRDAVYFDDTGDVLPAGDFVNWMHSGRVRVIL